MEKNVDKTKKKISVKNIQEVDFEVIWEDKPAGLIQQLLTSLNLNFTTYQITQDELIITKGFFRKRLNSCELYLLKDPDLTQNLYQRFLGISTVRVLVDSTSASERAGKYLYISNVRNGDKVRKLLRDAIEADVMERGITYFDKV